MPDNLKQKTIKGVSWSLVDNVANQGVTFVVGLVLARLITPEEYGLIGIIMIFIALFNCIVDSGFSNSLIRENSATSLDYNTIFIVNMATSIVLYFVLFECSPLIGTFFHHPELDILLKVTGIIVIVNATTIIQRTILVKAIDFKTQSIASLISSLLSGAAGIVAAFYGLGVWSLVLQQVARQLLYSIVLWMKGRWLPKIEFSLTRLRDHLGFSWKLLVSGIIDTIWKEIYQVVIGKYYSIYTLGQYTRSKQFSDGVTYGLLTVIQRVSFPSLSFVQNDDERFKGVLRKIIKMTMLILSPCIIGLAVSSDALIDVLVGNQWSDASRYLKIICFGILFSPVNILDQNVLQVKKDSRRVLQLNVMGKLFAALSVIVGIIFCVEAMLIMTALINTLIVTPLIIFYSTNKYLGYRYIDHFNDLRRILLATLVMGCSMQIVAYLSSNSTIVLGLQIIAGFFCYWGMCIMLKIEEYLEFKSIVVNYLRKVV